MSLKWYEQHVQQIVRENQQLKFNLRKLQERAPTNQIIHFFRTLFPDIPALSQQDIQNKEFEAVLEYYRRVIEVWLQKEKSKMEFLLSAPKQHHMAQTSILSTSKSTILSKSIIERERKCRRCEQDRSSKDLQAKIAQLEKEMRQLRQQIKQLEINEHNYLGQIALLRSITKKLEYELSQKIIMQNKLKKAYSIKARKVAQEIVQLRREVEIWKGEYERIWQEQQLQQSRTLKEEEVTSMNTSSRVSSTGNVWMIRGDEFEHSYITQH